MDNLLNQNNNKRNGMIVISENKEIKSDFNN
jgi:hypothetical protein